MAQEIFLGKDDLILLGIKFIVVNVPVFVVHATPVGVKKHTIKSFPSMEEMETYLRSIGTFAIFDMPAVYPTRRIKESQHNVYSVRHCPLTQFEVGTIKANIKEPTDVIYTFRWDFSAFV